MGMGSCGNTNSKQGTLDAWVKGGRGRGRGGGGGGGKGRPAGGAPASPQPQVRSTPCKYHLRGNCRAGSQCNYTHSSSSDAALSLLLASDPRLPFWGHIRPVLEEDTPGPQELLQLIRRCSATVLRGGEPPQLEVLEFYLEESLGQVMDPRVFFSEVLPWMKKAVLDTPFDPPIPLLKAGSTGQVVRTDLEVCVVLLHGFFCMVPHRYPRSIAVPSGGPLEVAYADALGMGFPDLNFTTLYKPPVTPVQGKQLVQKLHCLFAYFKAMYERCAGGGDREMIQVVRTAVSPNGFPKWNYTPVDVLAELSVKNSGAIEGEAGALQLDFANKKIGGGVLGMGCVQEEIRFLVSPGLFLARIVCETVGDNEAVRVHGARQFASYTGYGDDFRYQGPYRDPAPTINSYAAVTVVAADAINFKAYKMNPRMQYDAFYKAREANKMYAALVGSPELQVVSPKVAATGKWGCGVFGGDVQLKALLQLCAASQAGCSRLVFYTYGDPELGKALEKVHGKIKQDIKTVVNLYRALGLFVPGNGTSVFEHIMTNF